MVLMDHVLETSCGQAQQSGSGISIVAMGGSATCAFFFSSLDFFLLGVGIMYISTRPVSQYLALAGGVSDTIA